MTYSAPATLDEALAARAGGASVVAGGTDWYPALGEKPPPGRVLDLTRVAGLRGVDRTPEGWRIGAAARWSDVIEADLPPAFDGLKAAAREVGSVQIQNAGTVGGNLCNASPAADGVPPLLTLDASVELASPEGRRRLSLSDFILGPRRTALRPDELMTAILIPAEAGGAKGVFLKLGARTHLVISIAMVAAAVEVDAGVVARARVAVGSCSAVAARLPALEAALVGRSAAAGAPAIEPAHLAPLAPIDDVRADAAYRREAAAELCRRAVAEALAP